MRGGGEDGGAVGPWGRSGTEVLLELSDLLKRVKDIFVGVGGLETCALLRKLKLMTTFSLSI